MTVAIGLMDIRGYKHVAISHWELLHNYSRIKCPFIENSDKGILQNSIMGFMGYYPPLSCFFEGKDNANLSGFVLFLGVGACKAIHR